MPSPNPATRRDHAGAAVPTTLSGAMAIGDMSFTISSSSGWPAGTSGPFFVVIDPGGGSEEKVLCSSRVGTAIAVGASGRGADGTVAKTHGGGATVYPVWAAVEADEMNAHAAATSAVHGVVGSVVGTTDAQTLTNKIIDGATNTISNIAQAAVAGLSAHIAATSAVHGAAGTVVGTTDSQVLTNKTISGASNTLSNIAESAVTSLVSDLAAKALTSDITAHAALTTGTHGVGASVVVGTTLTQTLTNKTINASNNTLSNIPQSAVTNLVTDLAAIVDGGWVTGSDITSGSGWTTAYSYRYVGKIVYLQLTALRSGATITAATINASGSTIGTFNTALHRPVVPASGRWLCAYMTSVGGRGGVVGLNSSTASTGPINTTGAIFLTSALADIANGTTVYVSTAYPRLA